MVELQRQARFVGNNRQKHQPNYGINWRESLLKFSFQLFGCCVVKHSTINLEQLVPHETKHCTGNWKVIGRNEKLKNLITSLRLCARLEEMSKDQSRRMQLLKRKSNQSLNLTIKLHRWRTFNNPFELSYLAFVWRHMLHLILCSVFRITNFNSSSFWKISFVTLKFSIAIYDKRRYSFEYSQTSLNAVRG